MVTETKTTTPPTGAPSTIWKFSLHDGCALETLTLPRAAIAVSAAWQGRDLCVWFMLDPSAPTVTRRFRVVVTGAEIIGPHAHVATLHSNDGGSPLVLHVLEVLS